MKKIKDNIFTGILSGIIMPVLAFIFYAMYNSPNATVLEVWEVVVHLKILATIMSFSVFTNLIPFFIFIRMQSDKSSRGVLIATMLFVVAILIIRVGE